MLSQHQYNHTIDKKRKVESGYVEISSLQIPKNSLIGHPMYICGLIHVLTQHIDNEGQLWACKNEILKSTNSASLQVFVFKRYPNGQPELSDCASRSQAFL